MSKVRLNSDSIVLTVEHIDSQLQSTSEITKGTEDVAFACRKENLTVCNGNDLKVSESF
jgi:predicted Ser/Thr protein kinase